MSYSSVPRRLYRSRRGLFFGVCRGVAEYLDISVFWTRVMVFLAFLFTGFCPVGVVYLLAALLLKKAPWDGLAWEDSGGASEDAETIRARMRSRCDSLDNRLRRMESVVTSRGYNWDERLNNGA
jgi:phage shock protein C